MSYDTLLVSTPAPHVHQITLNRPEVSNAFNTEMATELVDAFERYQVDTDDIRAIVLTGAGERAFCAGGDLKQRLGMSDAAWQAQHLVYERMVRAILNCPVPVIGAINGAAYGGGCELAAAVDFAYAARSAKFAQTETRIGIIPGAGGTQTLARKIGTARAMELILSARVFSAEEAHNWGLINAVFDNADLLPAALDCATRIAKNAPVATRQAKRAITRGAQMSLSDGLEFEIACYNQTYVTQDRREGVAAFNEKRDPVFRGS
ncbi:enoyl-CoA hydratase/isomerase family protein [Primorskyibacter sp. S187A]|uniref:enoyl-CoA hydratase/isomerase family protein n=1 Tax=Primorskyibacter sp. S187A TaxID=3415130 RepID=UPI003C7BB2AF